MSEENTPATEQTFEQKVATAVDSMVSGDDGKMHLPDDHGLEEGLAFAANSERRRRDTQAEYSKGQNELKAVRAENEALVSGWEADIKGTLTNEQNTELEELKATDPDAWRQKLNDYEQSNLEAFGTKQTEIKKSASATTEVERRTLLLEEFNTENPDIEITDDLLANDVPPRYLKQLEAGEVTFEQMLANVKTFMTSGKVIKPSAVPHEEVDLTNSGGTNTPSPAAVDADIKKSYKTETY